MKYKFSLLICCMVILSASAHAQQRIMTLAGNGFIGDSGDGNSAVAASLYGPLGVAVDTFGVVYIEDFYNRRVRKVALDGIITTYAGTGVAGDNGDGTIASSAEVVPNGLAVDIAGNLYISDQDFDVIRKVNTMGIISTVAGRGIHGYTGDHGPALNAEFRHPAGIAVDKLGNLFIADAGNNVVRRVSSTTGIITTVAGNDSAGYTGDFGIATAAKLDSPSAVAVDLKGNLYITDYRNNVIRRVDTNNIITTYVGNTVYGFSPDGGPATAAWLNYPNGIAVDMYGNLFIADANNNVIRKVDTSATPIITTVAGNRTPAFGGDLGYATGANLSNPFAVAVDRYGNLYIADGNNQRVRKVYTPGLTVNGVANMVSGSGTDVYPNPFSGNITVAGLNASDKVCVYDMVGRQVSDTWTVKADGQQTFALNNLAPGMYMLKVWNSEGSKKSIVKIVKE